MEPDRPDKAQNPLFAFIESNPLVVVAVLGVLILISLVSIAAMLRIQAGADAAESTVAFLGRPTVRPSQTPTVRPTSTATPIPTETPLPSPTPTPMPTPIVINWREMGELQTLEVSTVTVFEEVNPRWWIVPDARVLVQVTGLANFGIDITLAEIEQNAESEGTSVRVVLPHASVTGVELVDAQVYDERWFPDAELGVDATAKALMQIESWAGEQQELLEIAETVGRAQLERFLRGLGFEEIEIVFE